MHCTTIEFLSHKNRVISMPPQLNQTSGQKLIYEVIETSMKDRIDDKLRLKQNALEKAMMERYGK